MVVVCYLYQPSKLKGRRKRATDLIWSLKMHHTEKSITKRNQLMLYHLHNGPKQGFIHEELHVGLLTPRCCSSEMIFDWLCASGSTQCLS